MFKKKNKEEENSLVEEITEDEEKDEVEDEEEIEDEEIKPVKKINKKQQTTFTLNEVVSALEFNINRAQQLLQLLKQ